jgi:hypothetical protein
MASMLRDLEAINAGADRAVLANPLLTTDLENLARAYSGDRARAAFGAVESRAHRARTQRRHQSRRRVAGRADVMALPRIALTVGDPAGIGPEIVARAAADPSVRAVCEPIVFRAAAIRDSHRRGVRRGGPRRLRHHRPRRRGREARRRRRDRDGAGQQARLSQAGLEWKGHTDLLAHLCGDASVAMMFHSPQLKVVLITVHVPLGKCRRRSPRSSSIETDRAHVDAMACLARRVRGSRWRASTRMRARRRHRHEDDRVLAPACERARARGVNIRDRSRATRCSCAPRAVNSTV